MDIEAQIDLARDQNTEFTERLDKYNTEKEEAEQNIGKFEEEIAAKEAEREKSTEDPAPHRAKAEEHRANIDTKMLKQLNEILNKASPEALCLGLEALVGILRNVNNANNIDVELFLKDPEKLLTKFKRMESHGLTYAHILKHKAGLEAQLPHFQNNNPNPGKDDKGKQLFNLFPFLAMIEWGVSFATAACIDLEKEDLDQQIAVLNQQLEDAKLLIERTTKVLEDIDEVKMVEYYEERPNDLAERKLTVDRIHIEDQRQAIAYQKELHNFEKTYFEKLRAAVKEANE